MRYDTAYHRDGVSNLPPAQPELQPGRPGWGVGWAVGKQMKQALVGWALVMAYNLDRLHTSNGGMSPVQFEKLQIHLSSCRLTSTDQPILFLCVMSF